jgi:hypothetical protein
MMLRNLLDELIRRRLWPIPALALLIALAAPVLFLKSTPAGTPAVPTTAPAPAETGGLPERAQRLLAANDAGAARGGATGSSHDPFQPPASARARAAAAARASKAKDSPSKDSSSDASPKDPIPVVIQNADGSSSASDSSSSSPSTPSVPRSSGNGSGSTPASAPSAPSAPSARTASVAVRFGKGIDSPLEPSVAPLQTFFIHGKLAAVFVKYSPSLDKAVFAVAPGIVITGPVKCRLDDGVCRYLDIPAGSYTRLTLVTADGTLARRRLDVARIDRTPASAGTTATAAKGDGENACLLRKLKTRKPGDALVDRDACER